MQLIFIYRMDKYSTLGAAAAAKKLGASQMMQKLNMKVL